MAGNDLSSVSPEDLGFGRSYSNGPRGTQPGASLDRLGSFRENGNGRPFGSEASMSRGKASDLPLLSQSLMLEPITLGDQKYSWCSELRRALGFSFGGISENDCFGAAHSKPLSSPVMDELKRFRGSVQDVNDKARIRVKSLDDNMNKLTAYLRKLQLNERSRGPNSMKVGAHPNMKSPDPVTQKVDDTGKNVLSKRARTPVADIRVEGPATDIPRQHMVLGKDKDIIRQGSLSSDSIEETIGRLPSGGESCDRKMKRRRSVSNVSPRLVDSDGEIKRAMHGRISSESGMPSPDAPAFRLGSSNGVAVSTKPDDTPSASASNVRPVPKNEMEKVSFSKELGGTNKEKILQNCNNKFNIHDENHLSKPSLLTKNNPSRATRAGPPGMGNLSPTFSLRASMTEDWEMPSNANKIHSLEGINNRKRVLSSELPSPPMAQWVGQRPQKISRIRRTSIISPTLNNDEGLISSEGCASSDCVLNSGGLNGSLPVRRMASNIQQLKVISENTPSPARLSDSEEAGPVEDNVVGSFESEERGVNGSRHDGSPGLLTKKTKLLVKEEIGDGVHKHERGRSSSFSRGSMSPLGGKLDSPATPKPVQSTKPGSDKNGSKSGRPPLKKHSERKGLTRLGLVPNGGLDNDREELLEAARFACNAKFLACSSSFWKKMEPLFSIRDDDRSYLLQQLNALGKHQGSPSEMFIPDSDMALIPPAFQKDTREEKHQPGSDGSEGEKVVITGFEPTNREALVDKGQDNNVFSRRGFEKEHNGMTSLHQRVLSALIMEDEFEELEQSNSFFSPSEVAYAMEENIFCNGNNRRCSSIDSHPNIDLFQGDYSFIQSEVGVLPASSQSNLNGSLTSQINMSSDSSSQGHYALMSMDEKLLAELQSIGLHPEAVSDFAGGEDELFSEEILLLKKQFHQEANKKKLCLERIWKAVEVEKGSEQRDAEQIALNRLVVLAHRKLLATRGNTAAKIGASKVPRHVALAFTKRTLARCRKFEDTGKSCFGEPGLLDVILAGPCDKPGTEQLGLHHDKSGRVLVESCDHLYAENVLILNSGKKKEVLLGDVGNGAFLKPSPLGNNLMGGVKGKRSDRDKDISSKSGRPSVSNIRGERKAKSKPKQREPQMSTHLLFPSTGSSAELIANGSSRKQKSLTSPGNILDSSKEGKDPADPTNLPELESVELGVVDNVFDGHQDLSSWLSLDDDIALDHDSMGLEIPMDDLSELSMLL